VSRFIDSFVFGSIDLGQAEIDEPAAGCLRVTARATPARQASALLCLLVALFTGWHTWRDVQASGAFGLWPGIAIVPVFALLMLGLAFFEHRKTFDAGARRAIGRSSLLGLHAVRAYALPERAAVRVSASVEHTRSEAEDMRRHYAYHIEVAGHAALAFTVQGEREVATAFAARLAGLLDYDVDLRLDDEETAHWPPLDARSRASF